MSSLERRETVRIALSRVTLNELAKQNLDIYDISIMEINDSNSGEDEWQTEDGDIDDVASVFHTGKTNFPIFCTTNPPDDVCAVTPVRRSILRKNRSTGMNFERISKPRKTSE